MKAAKLSQAQTAFIIKQGEEGMPVAEICRKAGISQATCFDRQRTYAGLLPPQIRRREQLEGEYACLKKVVADLTLGRGMLRGLYSGEGSEAWSHARPRPWDVQRVGAVDPDGISGLRIQPFDVSPQVPPHRSGCRREAGRGDLQNPTDNAVIEPFDGRFRAERLNRHGLLTLADVAERLELSREHDNEERRHGAIGNKVSIMLTKSGGRHQPVTLSEAGKLYLRVLQPRGTGQRRIEPPDSGGGRVKAVRMSGACRRSQ